MRLPGLELGVGFLDDVRGGVEIRVPDFEMNDIALLALELFGLGQDDEGALGLEQAHSLGETHDFPLGLQPGPFSSPAPHSASVASTSGRGSPTTFV